MLIITLTRKSGKPNRLVSWLVGKLMPGISLWITDPYNITVRNMPSRLLQFGEIVEPQEWKPESEIRIIINPQQEVR